MVKTTFVSTPDDGSCGIGTYTGELRSEFEDNYETDLVSLELGSLNPGEYLQAALQAGTSRASIVHIQHEYGIFGPKSVMSWLFFPCLFLITTLRRQSVVITLHSAWNHDTINEPLKPLKRIYVRLNNHMVAFVADHILFLSENCKEDFLKCVSLDSDNFEVFPHGIPTDTKAMCTKQAKDEFGFEENEFVIVEPGYVRKEKGHDIFIELAKQCPNYEFLIAGGCQNGRQDEYYRQLQDLAPSNVTITGVLDDDQFHATFNAADLIVLPYRDVSQSGIFNWCVAYGLPVVCSNSGYFQDLNEDHGCVGLFNIDNTDEMVESITSIIEDPQKRETLSKKMKEYRDSRAMDKVAQQHTELYHSLHK